MMRLFAFFLFRVFSTVLAHNLTTKPCGNPFFETPFHFEPSYFGTIGPELGCVSWALAAKQFETHVIYEELVDHPYCRDVALSKERADRIPEPEIDWDVPGRKRRRRRQIDDDEEEPTIDATKLRRKGPHKYSYTLIWDEGPWCYVQNGTIYEPKSCNFKCSEQPTSTTSKPNETLQEEKNETIDIPPTVILYDTKLIDNLSKRLFASVDHGNTVYYDIKIPDKRFSPHFESNRYNLVVMSYVIFAAIIAGLLVKPIIQFRDFTKLISARKKEKAGGALNTAIEKEEEIVAE